jgi:hypothetical protein
MVKGAGLRAVLLALAVLCVAASTASAEPIIGTLTGASGGSAKWVKGPDAPGENDGYAIRLLVPSSGSFAGFNYISPPSTAPAAAPSFEFMATQSAPAGGSPRLVLAFANGDYIYAAPAAWTANAWSTVGGSGSNWYDAGQGGCAALSNVSYAQALNCSGSSRLSSAYLVADSPTSATLYIDDVRFAGLISTEPGNVLSTVVSRFRHTINVNRHTGIGRTTLAFCLQANGSCRIAMRLTLRRGGHTITVGRLTGRIAVQGSKRLRIQLNRTGRRLLARAHRLHVTATGRWSPTGKVHRLRLTLKT